MANLNPTNTVKQPKTPPAASTQRFLPLAEVRENTLVLKNGGLRAVLQTSSVNFNLKSEDEQNALIASYQGFLNSLEFPVQIVIRSKKLDVEKYIDHVEELAKNQSNQLLQKQTVSYAEYIKKLVEYADIMEKKFYVVVPVDPLRAEAKKGFFKDFFSLLEHLQPQDSVSKIQTRQREFDALRRILKQRVDSVVSALESCNIRAEQLDTAGLVELMYQCYNPLTAREQKVENFKNMNFESNA